MQLAGVVAVEITGGPDVPFHPGRQVREIYLFQSSILLKEYVCYILLFVCLLRLN